jgi:hypothetical protein
VAAAEFTRASRGAAAGDMPADDEGLDVIALPVGGTERDALASALGATPPG